MDLMRSTRTRPTLGRIAAIALAAIIAATIPSLVAPAAPASALAIDCSYSPGLHTWVDSGHAPGVVCQGRNPDPGSTTGSSGTASPRASGPGSSPNCLPHQNNLPPFFLENATRHDSTSFTDSFDWDTQTGVSTTRNYLNNRLHGQLQIHRQWVDGKASFIVVYWLFENGRASTATFKSTQRCDTGYTYGEPFKMKAPSGTGDIRELVNPGVAMEPYLGQLETRGSMTPIPGDPDAYFVRVDLTNPADGIATPATLDVGFGNAFDLSSVASVPASSSCDIVARAVQQCSVDAVAPGQTSTFLFAAKAKPGVGQQVTLPVTVSNRGWMRSTIEQRPGLEETRNRIMPVTNLYTLTRPAPATVTLPPATPVCEVERAPGATALPGSTPDQNVVAGEPTKLQAHCTNTTGYPMKATAAHGTTTMDSYGWVTYTADAGHRGPDAVSVVSVAPGSGAESAPASIGVNVVAPAEAKDDTFSVAGNAPWSSTVSILANDRVPATEGWMVQLGTTPPAHGTLALDTKTGQFTYTPQAGYVGTDSFKYRLSGPGGAASNVVTVTLTVVAP
jgi:hypothetical protein